MRIWLKDCSFTNLKKAMIALFAAAMLAGPSSAFADSASPAVNYEEDGTIGKQLNIPLYHWWMPSATPRGVVLAVHGLVMHGRSFGTLGKTLAADGFAVYAMDLRGYGRCLSENHEFCDSQRDCKQKIDYERSYEDLKRVARCLREKYPSLPVFAIGESLGGTMTIKLAATNPELVDGLILAAPAVKRHSFLDPYMLANAGMIMTNPRAQLDLMPFVRKFSSDDPRVVAEKEADPLLRRHMSAFELMQSSLTVRKTVSYIPEVPVDMPVLVIQGSADRCIKAQAVMVLLANLRSADQTVKWFHERGHILLETAYVKPDTMDAVVSWLDTHVNSPSIQAKCNHTRDIIAGEDKTKLPVLSTKLPAISTMASLAGEDANQKSN